MCVGGWLKSLWKTDLNKICSYVILLIRTEAVPFQMLEIKAGDLFPLPHIFLRSRLQRISNVLNCKIEVVDCRSKYATRYKREEHGSNKMSALTYSWERILHADHLICPTGWIWFSRLSKTNLYSKLLNAKKRFNCDFKLFKLIVSANCYQWARPCNYVAV